MISKTGIALAVFCCLFSIAAHAQQNVKGIGWYRCHQLSDLYDGASRTETEQLDVMIFSWVQGYVSGKNLERRDHQQKDVSELNPVDVLAAIDQYCSFNVDLQLYRIANDIYDSLPARATPIG